MKKQYDYGSLYYMLANAKSRAKKMGAPFNLTAADVTIPATCPVLGIALTHGEGGSGPRDNSPTLDRAKPELGYVRGNVNVISHKANRLKAHGTLDEIRAVVRWMESIELLL